MDGPIVRLFLLVALLAACTAGSPPPPDATASPSPVAEAAATSVPSAPPDELAPSDPTVKVGRALSVAGPTPAPGMTRLNGKVLSKANAPLERVCVTLGPPIHCAVLTDDDGSFVIDFPQGPITWEFHFLRDGKEIVPARTFFGPFQGDFERTVFEFVAE